MVKKMDSDKKLSSLRVYGRPFLLPYLVSSVVLSIFSKYWIVGLVSGPLIHLWYCVVRVLPNSHKYMNGVSRVGLEDYLYGGASFVVWVFGYFLIKRIVNIRSKKWEASLAMAAWLGVGFINVFIIAISSV